MFASIINTGELEHVRIYKKDHKNGSSGSNHIINNKKDFSQKVIATQELISLVYLHEKTWADFFYNILN